MSTLQQHLQEIPKRFDEEFPSGSISESGTGIVHTGIYESRNFMIKSNNETAQILIEDIKRLITNEIATACIAGQPTSRLTSLYNLISELTSAIKE